MGGILHGYRQHHWKGIHRAIGGPPGKDLEVVDVQDRPYRWNLRRLNRGMTLDIGCGIRRCLKNLPLGSVGIDHNEHSVQVIRKLGLERFSPEEFLRSSHCKLGSFDTLLLRHLLEHMAPHPALELIEKYLLYVRSGGQVIIVCPQEKGFSTDATHVHFFDTAALASTLTAACW